MADAEYRDVRVKESLRVKIGEAKNLPASSFSGSGRNTCCAIKIDSEEIFRTNTVDKSSDPFFAAEFQGEIPKKFRYLSFYMYEVGNKNKVLGKVSLKKEELYKYHQKEHWFPLTYQDGDTEVQGKVHVELKLDEYLTPSSDTSHMMSVRVIECTDLTVINGSCNPYAVVSLSYGKSKTKDIKKTGVKRKTICPQFGETFYFCLDNKGQNQEKSSYVFEDFWAGELSIALFHDDSKVSREVLGNIFKGAFLGEIKISIKDIDFCQPHKAWYCLQAKEKNRTNDLSLGSIRLRISYTADYVFPSKYYDGLRNLILKSVENKPFTSSAVFILGNIVNHQESSAREIAAQSLVKLFLHHGKLVPVINALACWEMSTTTDPNTLFRGNSLLTKMVDELMKIVGLPYLHDTLKSFVDQVIRNPRPCEIDQCRLKEGEDLKVDMNNLYGYVKDILDMIVGSGLVCPPILRDVFSTLKSQAILKYRTAIMRPNLFDLYSDTLEPCVQRTFTLISKGISGVVSLVSSKSNTVAAKEEYMTPLFEMFPQMIQTEIKMFLDIISSSSGSHVKVIEAPIVLKEGYLIKRAQGRKRFGMINFKKRFFDSATNLCHILGAKHTLFEIPITDILAVERLEEESFKMKYMFQVIHAQRVLYIQASNCVEEKEWLDILSKICKSNKNRLKCYHPAAFINNHWLCCKLTDPTMPGCKPVTGGLPLDDILGEIDSDSEVEKIHSLFLSAIDLLDDLQGYIDADDVVCDGRSRRPLHELRSTGEGPLCNLEDEICGSQAVYSGDTDVKVTGLGLDIEDPSTCFSTISEIQNCIITLEQEHLQYMHSLQSRTVIGSVDAPIGDDSNTDLVRNINRSSERLSRHGSRSSNASNISRQSFFGSHSRGGSFQERGQINNLNHEVRKSASEDITSLTQHLGVVSAAVELLPTSICDLVSREKKARSGSGDSGRGTDCSIIDISSHGNNNNLTDTGIDLTISDCTTHIETAQSSNDDSDLIKPELTTKLSEFHTGNGLNLFNGSIFISSENCKDKSENQGCCLCPHVAHSHLSSPQNTETLEASPCNSRILTDTLAVNKTVCVNGQKKGSIQNTVLDASDISYISRSSTDSKIEDSSDSVKIEHSAGLGVKVEHSPCPGVKVEQSPSPGVKVEHSPDIDEQSPDVETISSLEAVQKQHSLQENNNCCSQENNGCCIKENNGCFSLGNSGYCRSQDNDCCSKESNHHKSSLCIICSKHATQDSFFSDSNKICKSLIEGHYNETVAGSGVSSRPSCKCRDNQTQHDTQQLSMKSDVVIRSLPAEYADSQTSLIVDNQEKLSDMSCTDLITDGYHVSVECKQESESRSDYWNSFHSRLTGGQSDITDHIRLTGGQSDLTQSDLTQSDLTQSDLTQSDLTQSDVTDHSRVTGGQGDFTQSDITDHIRLAAGQMDLADHSRVVTGGQSDFTEHRRVTDGESDLTDDNRLTDGESDLTDNIRLTDSQCEPSICARDQEVVQNSLPEFFKTDIQVAEPIKTIPTVMVASDGLVTPISQYGLLFASSESNSSQDLTHETVVFV